MLAALLQKELGENFLVESAGVARRGGYAQEYAILCMWEKEIDLINHESRWVGNLHLSTYSHIVCVDDATAVQVTKFLNGRKDTIVLIANKERGGISNPSEKGLPAFRECLALLEKTLFSLTEQIRR
jgi:protein-tyrosine-phosphatase